MFLFTLASRGAGETSSAGWERPLLTHELVPLLVTREAARTPSFPRSPRRWNVRKHGEGSLSRTAQALKYLTQVVNAHLECGRGLTNVFKHWSKMSNSAGYKSQTCTLGLNTVPLRPHVKVDGELPGSLFQFTPSMYHGRPVFCYLSGWSHLPLLNFL